MHCAGVQLRVLGLPPRETLPTLEIVKVVCGEAWRAQKAKRRGSQKCDLVEYDVIDRRVLPCAGNLAPQVWRPGSPGDHARQTELHKTRRFAMASSRSACAASGMPEDEVRLIRGRVEADALMLSAGAPKPSTHRSRVLAEIVGAAADHGQQVARHHLVPLTSVEAQTITDKDLARTPSSTQRTCARTPPRRYSRGYIVQRRPRSMHCCAVSTSLG